MKISKGDKVQIMAGKDKGKIAEVLRVFIKENTVLVEGVNMIKKHVKPTAQNKEGGIVTFEKPVNVSNVMYYSEEDKRPVRLGYKTVEGKKIRVMKKLDKVVVSKAKKAKSTDTVDKGSLKKKAEKK